MAPITTVRQTSPAWRDNPQPPASDDRQPPVRSIAIWWPMPVLLALVVLLALFDHTQVHEPPYLLPILNIGVLFIGGVAAAALAAGGYWAGGSLAVLLLGSAMLVFGLGSLAAAVLVPLERIDTAVTTYNVAALFSSLFHLTGAVSLLLPRTEAHTLATRRRMTSILYGGVVGVMGLIAWLGLLDLLPHFMGPSGPSPLRQVVLTVSVTLFFSAALLFGLLARRATTTFLVWY